ncbi:MAG: hypothetical protein LBP73_09020 [Clostridiales Family XIII bacterium]|nr:hypothetical protein [Clostridiales Family XIII bacterium]
MKKTGGMFFAVLLTIVLSTAPCFAAGLSLVENHPEEGSRSSPPINLGIKLFFDRDVSSDEALRKQNESCFKLLDDKGQSVPLKVLYTEADPNYILVIAEPEDEKNGLGSDREYRFEISPELLAADDSTLEEPKVITFRTRNTSMDTTLSMVLMGVMFAVMMVFSAISMRRQAKKAAVPEDRPKVNPYKVAKETGKSVTEIVAKEEKKKRRTARKTQPGASPADRDKNGAAGEAASEKEANAAGRRVKRVKGPRPIAAAGSSYRTGRKAAAEKKAREEAARRARGTTRPKGQTARSKKKK